MPFRGSADAKGVAGANGARTLWLTWWMRTKMDLDYSAILQRRGSMLTGAIFSSLETFSSRIGGSLKTLRDIMRRFKTAQAVLKGESTGRSLKIAGLH